MHYLYLYISIRVKNVCEMEAVRVIWDYDLSITSALVLIFGTQTYSTHINPLSVLL
jgi:hypothetical protein